MSGWYEHDDPEGLDEADRACDEALRASPGPRPVVHGDAVTRLRALLAEATPGPWKHTRPTEPDVSDDDVRVCYLRDGEHCEWCVALAGETDGRGAWTRETLDRWHADAALVAALRNAAPALLDVAEAAQAAADARADWHDSPNRSRQMAQCSLRMDKAAEDIRVALRRLDEVSRG